MCVRESSTHQCSGAGASSPALLVIKKEYPKREQASTLVNRAMGTGEVRLDLHADGRGTGQKVHERGGSSCARADVDEHIRRAHIRLGDCPEDGIDRTW